ncbi:CDP-diacylglycerol--serine O-phosphatidyltransferase [Oceanidesulfovibrio indonesiensis]|uniref:CDP-diacylglycerol--serine O-phosphatidyltransferase n=1 Tax=Oceanidesulfovibrio indonesiensis TaxID=54767 RepID=A0A7M3MG10_9BACT|nr:CDP-diacylglycerol--serine O-phosphatidyltransferase [Oceanidesulfovibrio indonesiensis]TVM18258.1 CDP-diacylglycerol--serine O-phosphatidyltransferase [Oceanidesulfovibrio indonesiensis]
MDEPAKNLPVHRGVYILPNLLTTASLCAGFMSMVMVQRGEFENAAIAILVSWVFDGLDGKVARLTRTTSEFGVQFDSLSDVVAFGAAPAFMIYNWALVDYGRLGMMAAFFFLACGAMRLARFNIQRKVALKHNFVGLPIPAAGCTIATMVLFAERLPEMALPEVMEPLALVLAFGLPILMVSKVLYPSFKDHVWFKAQPFGSMVTAILLFVFVASDPYLFGFPLFLGYGMFGVLYTFAVLAKSPSKRLGHCPQESTEEIS